MSAQRFTVSTRTAEQISVTRWGCHTASYGVARRDIGRADASGMLNAWIETDSRSRSSSLLAAELAAVTLIVVESRKAGRLLRGYVALNSRGIPGGSSGQIENLQPIVVSLLATGRGGRGRSGSSSPA